MNSHLESVGSPPAEVWREQLEASASLESAWWMPPGRWLMDWMDLETLCSGSAQSKPAALFGPRQACDFSIPPGSETAEPGSPLARLLELATVGQAPQQPDSPELFLGFPYLWVPPQAEDNEESLPILVPLARLPVEIAHNSTPGRLSIRARPNPDGTPGEVQPNPVFIHWLETMTGESQDGWLAEAPAEPWRLLPWLVEQVAMILDLPEGTGRAVTPFRRLPPLGNLPFSPAILPSAVLGYFPTEPPLWQRELRQILMGAEVSGPARRFLTPDHPPAPRPSRPDTHTWWTGDPALTQIGQQAQENELTILRSPDTAAKFDLTTGLIVDHLARGERVLVVSDSPAERAGLEVALEALGLGDLCARSEESGFPGANCHRHLLQKYAASTAPVGHPVVDGIGTLERRWQELKARLTAAARAVHQSGPDGRSFHDLAGEWLELLAVVPPESGEPTDSPRLAEVDKHRQVIEDTLAAAARMEWADSPWPDALSVRPEVVRATSLMEWERVFASLLRRAEVADKAFEAGDLAFSADVDIAEQVTARHSLAEVLQPLVGWDRPNFCARVAAASPPEVEALARQRETLRASAAEMIAQPLDPDLWNSLREIIPSLTTVAENLRILGSRLPNAPATLAPANKAALAQVLQPLGLKSTPGNIQRAWEFFRGLSHRLQMAQMVNAWLHAGRSRLLDDQSLRRDWEGTGAVLAAVEALNHPALRTLHESTMAALASSSGIAEYIDALRRSTRSAQVLADFEHGVLATGLFAPLAYRQWRDAWSRGEPRVKLATAWHRHIHHLPEAVAFQSTLASLPPSVAAHLQWHVKRGAPPDIAILAIQRAACAGELANRRQLQPILGEITGESLESNLQELADLSHRRRLQLLQSIRRTWSLRSLQDATSPSDERIASGQALVDLRPVWIASPELAAEGFTRPGLFDLLVFLDGARCPFAASIALMQRARRAVILDCPVDPPAPAAASQPGAEWNIDSSRAGLLDAAISSGCPTLSTAPAPDCDRPKDELSLPMEVPYSRIHHSAKPSRTLAAIGALARNQCRISTEVHWMASAGEIDLALVNVAHPAPPRVGWMVDFSRDETDPDPVSRWVNRWESFRSRGWSLHAIWTPELVARGEELLATLAADAGIPSEPAHEVKEESSEIYPDFSAPFHPANVLSD